MSRRTASNALSAEPRAVVGFRPAYSNSLVCPAEPYDVFAQLTPGAELADPITKFLDYDFAIEEIISSDHSNPV